jgi:hypothetical protein
MTRRSRPHPREGCNLGKPNGSYPDHTDETAAHHAMRGRALMWNIRSWGRVSSSVLAPYLPVIFKFTDADPVPPSLAVTVTLATGVAAAVYV